MRLSSKHWGKIPPAWLAHEGLAAMRVIAVVLGCHYYLRCLKKAEFFISSLKTPRQRHTEKIQLKGHVFKDIYSIISLL